MEKRVRTRFAPSPTGYMHIGNLRTALYAYLLAKKYDGDFILRIEDTDQERYVEGAVDIIYNTLRIAGLKWDEGPDIGGPVGPYVQSERMGMFKGYAEQLVKSGHAYYCFCGKERLEEVRKIQEASHIAPMYDRHCRNLTPEEIQEKLDAGVPYVIRQKMPLDGTTTFHDEVYGDITVENSTLDDQILIKTDGMPTYNFANVVDDHLMGITHVIRGNEYLSSAPKYNLLYQAFGWDVPVYIHCSPVMKDKTHKLSKRNGDASFQDLLEKGYLPEAIINFIALLGWAPTGEQEIFTMDELIQAFEISGISKSPALFDPVKLKAINGEYIRKMTPEAFAEKAIPYIRQVVHSETADLQLLCHVLQPRTELFTDIPEQVDFIDALPDYDVELYRHKKMKTTPETAKEALTEILPVLEGISDWTVDSIHAAVFARIGELGVKNGWMLWPLRTALSGKPFTPGGGIELCAILGKDETLKRVQMTVLLIPFFTKERERRIPYISFFGSMAVFLVIDKILVKYFRHAIWGNAAAHATGIPKGTLKLLRKGTGIKSYIRMAIGWLYNSFSSTLGLVCVGLIACVIIVFLMIRRSKKVTSQEGTLALFGFLSYAGSFVLGTVFFLKSVKKNFYGTSKIRVDRIVYDRYICCAFGILCMVALYVLIWKRDLFGIRAKMLSVAGCGLTLVLFSKITAPYLNNQSFVRKYMGMLCTFVKTHAGKLTFEGKHVSGGVILFGVVALLLFLLVLLLCQKKKGCQACTLPLSRQ